jgi:FAD/FMN-containing dehydrogenase
MDSPLALPPNIDRNTFARALKELRAIVGEPHVSVLSSREQLDDGDYLHQPKAHDGFHLLAQDELIASCTIEPATVEHVQDVVKLANKYKIPLWPISIGRNLGYGGKLTVELTGPFVCPSD